MPHIRTLILLVFGIGLLFFALRSLRQQRLKERYALVMIFSGLPFLVLAFWPRGLLALANVMDIGVSALMVMLLTLFVVLMIFKLLSVVSVQGRQIATLTQLIGILMEHQKLTFPPTASDGKPTPLSPHSDDGPSD